MIKAKSLPIREQPKGEIMGIDALAFSLGALLLLVGILGGGFELREFKVPPVGKVLRLIAAAVGLFFILLGLGLHPNASDPVAFTTKPLQDELASTPAPTPDMVELHKPSLISAIRQADGAEIQAQRNLDATPLYSFYTGEALRMELAAIQDLRAADLFKDATLEDQDFQDFQVNQDGSTAKVRVIETWRSVYYQASTGKCVQQMPSRKLPQTIHLKRSEKGWIVDAVIHDLNVATTNPIPCS
jgi:hypothetical protein